MHTKADHNFFLLLRVVQVVLDKSISYDDFVIPHCPGCDAEGRKNSIVRFHNNSEIRRDALKME
jgi:hypothetical protein